MKQETNSASSNAAYADMAQNWLNVQQQMWASWQELMQSAPTIDPALAEQWQAMAEQNMSAWMSGATPIAQATAAQMLTSQKALFSLFEQFAKAWPQSADPGAWQTAFADYATQMQKQLAATTQGMAGAWPWQAMPQQPYGMFGMNNGTGATANVYLQAWQDSMAKFFQAMGMPGTSAFGTMQDMSAMMMGEDLVNRTFNAYQQTVGQFLDSPPLGYAREYDERVRQLAKAALTYQQASNEYQALIGEAWVAAMTQFQEALVERSQTGEPITSLNELADAWFAVADPAFTDIFKEERFIRSQGRLLSATMELRVKQRAIVENLSSALDIPTRTEIDQVHKTLYAQRKEVKALQRALSAAQAEITELKAGISSIAAETSGTGKSNKRSAAAKTKSTKSAKTASAAGSTKAKKSSAARKRKSAQKDEA